MFPFLSSGLKRLSSSAGFRFTDQISSLADVVDGINITSHWLLLDIRGTYLTFSPRTVTESVLLARSSIFTEHWIQEQG